MFHLRQGADDIADPVEAAGTDYCFYLIAEAGDFGVGEEMGGGLLDSFWFVWTLARLLFSSFSIGEGRSRRKARQGETYIESLDLCIMPRLSVSSWYVAVRHR